MPNLTLNLFALGCTSRSQIVLHRDECDPSIAFIKFAGHTYMCDWNKFRLENFKAELELIV